MPVSAVRAAVAAGDIPALTIGGYVRISRDALLQRAALDGGRAGTVRYGRARRTVFGYGFICEFAETADGSAWASLIKPDGRSTLPLVAPPPPLYRTARLGNWRAVTGWQKGGHPEAQAVLIGKDDLRSMVHHAVTRWLAKKHHPLAPAA